MLLKRPPEAESVWKGRVLPGELRLESSYAGVCCEEMVMRIVITLSCLETPTSP